jgi:hypothetical protein
MPDINTLTGIGYPKRKIGCVLGVKVRIQADILENQLQSNCTMKSKVRPSTDIEVRLRSGSNLTLN